MKTNGNSETAGIEKPRKHNFLRLWGGLVQRTFPFMEEEVGELCRYSRHSCSRPCMTFRRQRSSSRGFFSNHRRGGSAAGPIRGRCRASRVSEINKEFAEMGFTEEWFDEFVRPYAVDEPGGTLSLDSAPIPVRVKAANSKRRRLSPHIRLVGAAREIDLHAARLERLQEQDRARHVVGRRRRLARQHLVALHGDGCHQHAVVFVLVEPRIVGRGTIYCARLGRDALLRVRRGRATLLAALPPPGTPSSGGWSARPSSRR